VLVSTGGFIEHVLTLGSEAVDRYIHECKSLGFDIVEISSGFISIPDDDWLRLIDALPLDRVMFEAADPEVFACYVKNYGPEVNLFVDHSQIVQLESLRLGIWGTKSLWGRVVTYKG
jgi:phosphosulfolactate synthase (CoM biosynthesis protein A)